MADEEKSVVAAEAEDPEAAGHKGMSVLAYLGLLLLIPLFADKDSSFTRYHVKQGVNLFLYYLATWIISMLLGLFTVTKEFMGIPYQSVPFWVSLIRFVLWVFGLVLCIIGIVHAAKGQRKELPILGKYNFMDPLLKKINPQM